MHALPLPSVAVAVISALPGALASISPFTTDIISGLLDAQATALFVAFSGSTVADNTAFSPTFMVFGASAITMLSSGTVNSCTIMVTVSATVGLSADVAVITAFPSALASILPFPSTEIISGLLDTQVTALFVAFSGSTATDKSAVFPTPMLSGAPVIVIFSTGTIGSCTLMATVAFVPDASIAVTVITASPAAFASTVPFAFTDKTSGLLDVQATALSVAFSGNTAADNAAVSPTSIISGAFAISIFDTNTTGSFTVIATDADLPDPSAAVAVTSACPAAFAVMAPSASTDTTALLLEVHTTALFVAFSGNTVADSTPLSPTTISLWASPVIVTDSARISLGSAVTVISSVTDLPP